MIKPLQPGFRPRENRLTSLRRRGCMVFHSRMLIMPYGTARSSRNADFISIARRAIHNPRGRRPRQTLEPSGPWGRSILRTFPFEPSEPSEPSHRRCVQWRSRIGGGERSEPISRMLFMTYDADRLIRNADFISIARRAIHNPRPKGPSNLRTFRTLRAKPGQPSRRRRVRGRSRAPFPSVWCIIKKNSLFVSPREGVLHA